MASYPLTFDIEQPAKFDRLQVVIRILISIILGALAFIPDVGVFLGIPGGLLYLIVPVVAAILISQKGAQRYLAERDRTMVAWLRWAAALYAYFALLTDRLPNQDPRETLRFEVTPDGEPSAGHVLLRIILALPHGIVLLLLGLVAIVLAVIALIMILVQEKYPEGIYGFLRGYTRWVARVYVYLAGLAQAYPPFALDTGREGGEAIAAGVVPTPQPPAADTGATP